MDLRYFINQCEAADELKRVTAEVDWNLEISHVSKLTEEKKGPALLFENIKGYSSPVFTGAFATTKRLASMLGLPHNLSMCESARAWMKKTITSEGLIKAKEVKDGPVLENIISGDEVDPSDIDEAAVTAGLHTAGTFNAAVDWRAHKLVAPRTRVRR